MAIGAIAKKARPLPLAASIEPGTLLALMEDIKPQRLEFLPVAWMFGRSHFRFFEQYRPKMPFTEGLTAALSQLDRDF